ncbi:disease resistance protein RPM1-like [Triticum aestivum]|uniref:Disease resistance protein RPM1 n=3 Tax=Triticum TaxID=4564 RepID=A0A9R0W4L9_TRITD|nr:disease resistance protein RPM1-like [Triticum aestivum]VAH98521.1 unnamed protein product [Triticum turgidum subsp. durum]
MHPSLRYSLPLFLSFLKPLKLVFTLIVPSHGRISECIRCADCWNIHGTCADSSGICRIQPWCWRSMVDKTTRPVSVCIEAHTGLEGMAEAIVGSLILKLGDALVNEVVELAGSLFGLEGYALKGLFSEIQQVKSELESIQAFLHAAESFRDTDETTAAFVRQIRILSFNIEDVVDEFTYELADDGRGMLLFKAIRRVRQIKIWYRLAGRLRDIKADLRSAAERRGRYDLKGIQRDARLPGRNGSNWSCLRYTSFEAEDDPVGIEEEKKFLMKWVQDKDRRNLIAAVWGMGGIGKTTLAHHVYSSVKDKFDICAWVTVSQSSEADDLLRKIVEEFRKNDRKKKFPKDVDVTDCRSLVKAICCYLEHKRYILVLDDVWNVNVWFDCRDAFLHGKGRILFTSRIYEVASLASESNIINLQPLGEDDAMDLFCREAFQKEDKRICPPELSDSAGMFVTNCNGLPIAIKCIGRLLSLRSTCFSEWEKVYNMKKQLTDNPVMDMHVILKVSLEDLPHSVRSCFLYCCMFPEKYVMQRKSLVRLWVAEGFVEESEHKTLEEVAEDYLTELIHRCLLLVVKRNDSGCVYEVQMHDIFRVLARSKAREENFCGVYNPLKIHAIREARRVSTETGDIALLAQNAPHLRSLLVFDSSFSFISLRSLAMSNRLLSVLNLQDSSIKRLPAEVFGLHNLRFLGLWRTKVSSLPGSIGRLKNLLVLDAWKCEITKLPLQVMKLSKLTHLIVTSKHVGPSLQFVPSVGVPAPAGICSLTSLQTLLQMEASAEMVRSMGALVELRTFRISKLQGSHCEDLFNGIGRMIHLTRLGIQADNQEILLLRTFQPPPLLQKLFLLGALSKESLPNFLTEVRKLKNLKFLRLVGSRLNKDAFLYLKGLEHLVKLQLYDAYAGDKLFFPAASFPKLRVLKIRGGPYLDEIEIERGAMASLVDLKLLLCPQLKMLPDGIEHVRTLEELTLDVAEELVDRVWQKKERKILHIQRVYVGPQSLPVL